MTNNVGERNRLLTIKRRSNGVDAANQPIDTWEVVAKRWGRPMTSTGMSVVRAAEQGVPAVSGRYSWDINYTPDLFDVGMRAEYKGIIYDILDIRHDHANREYTHLVCQEGVNNG